MCIVMIITLLYSNVATNGIYATGNSVNKYVYSNDNYSFIFKNTYVEPEKRDITIKKVWNNKSESVENTFVPLTLTMEGLEPNTTYEGAGTSDSEGRLTTTFTPHNGFEQVVRGIPVGATYQLTEASGEHSAQYAIVDTNGGNNIVNSEASARKGESLSTRIETVDANENVEITFTNTLEGTRPLTIKKVVDYGTYTPRSAFFSFELNMSGLEPGKVYVSDTGDILEADSEGNASMYFNLEDDESIKFDALPIGAKYTITEEAIKSYRPSYDITTEGTHAINVVKAHDEANECRVDLSTATETIDEEDYAIVTFTNHYEPDMSLNLKINKRLASSRTTMSPICR